MGGLLFGYDTAVVSGAEQQIQEVFGLSSALHGLVMSSALWGTVLGALFGGRITDRFGRRPTLQSIGLLYLISAVWSGLAGGPVELIIARFIGGLAVGCSSIAAPVYIAEISPAEKRGRMTACFQLNIVIGIVIAQFVNVLIGKMGGPDMWRWMLGAEAVPALIFAVLSLFLTETPRWLAERGELKNKKSVPLSQIFCKANARPIFLAIAVAFFNQMSGVNAILWFMKRIYMMAGFTDDIALKLVALTGVMNAVGTIIGMSLIDKFGRKTLLIIGGIGYLISLFTCMFAFHAGQGVLATVCVILFILSHAIGQGTVIWVLIAEVFPTAFRAQGQSIGAFTHWFMSAVITLVFPIAVAAFAPEVLFGFFGVMMILHLLWAIFLVPETKGRTLEEINEDMKK